MFNNKAELNPIRQVTFLENFDLPVLIRIFYNPF